MMERRSEGLCFNCDEKFSAGHVCKNKHIFMITAEIEEKQPVENSEEPLLVWSEEEECNPWGTGAEREAYDGDRTELSLHSLSGTQGLNTITLQGKIKGMYVTILIDSGSSQYFIAQYLVKQLKIPTTNCQEVEVTVANGEKLKSKQTADRVNWVMNGELFVYNFSILPI